jgi:non-specific protein-tyrosine kinase
LGTFVGSSKFIKPLYQSTALIEVAVNFGGSPLSNDNILASQQLAGTEAQLATTYPVLSAVASRYPGLTADSLAKEVTATANANTQLFQISVQDSSPQRAASLANDVASTLIKQQNAAVAQQVAATPAAQQNAAVARQNTATPVAQQNAAQASFLVIVQPALPSATPSQTSKLVFITAGLLVGLLLGVVLAIILELLDTRVGTGEALAQLLGWSILGTVWQTGHGEDIINPIDQDSNVESYSILRTNIGFAAIDKPLQTLVVTSGKPGEGRTVVATNLAIFMARAGKNTLLIDANLRQPTLHEQFGIPAHAMGFSNAVLMFNRLTTVNPLFTSKTGSKESTVAAAGEASLGPFVRVGDIPNLYVMPSGPLPPNPPELLDSKAMQGFFAALRSCGAEVVIFDTPPLLGLSDASILASKVDGTLIVVDINHASKGSLGQMKALLEQAKVRVIGCVVNKQRRSRKDTPESYGYRAGKRSKRGSRSKQNTSYPAAPLVTSGVVSKQSTPPPQSAHVESVVAKQSTPSPQSARVESVVAKQSTSSQSARVESVIAKQSTPPQSARVESVVTKQSTSSSELVRTESTVTKQSTSSSEPVRTESTVTKQSTSPSEPVRTEPTATKQPASPPQPASSEPTVMKQSAIPSQLEQDKQNNGANYSTNTIDSPAASHTVD